MIIQGDNIIVNGNTVDATKLDNHDLISVTSVGNAAVGGTIPNGVDSTFTYLMSSSVAMLGRPTEGGFYKNAYYDGTTYRRINAGAAQRIYMSTDGNIGIEGALTDVAGSALTFSSLLNISKEGYISTPKQPAFRARANAYTATADVALNYPNVYLNDAGCYNSSNSTFTAPVAGKYIFGGMTRLNGNYSYVYTEVYINGTRLYFATNELSGLTTTGFSSFTAGSFIIIVKLNANDSVRCGYGSSSASCPIDGQTHWWGYLLG